MEAINLSNLSVDSSGRVVFSGLSSGIDAEGIVASIIAAKRIPIDSIENRIVENEDQIAALGDLRTLLTGLRQSLTTLRGAVTLGNAGDIFSAKRVFATTSRTDGALPSAAGNLIGVTTTNAAAAGSHNIEVLRVATAHKVASKTFSSETTALSLSGTFDVTGKGGSATITVSGTDTLQDVRDRINNANTGVNGTGVTASIVQTSATGFILVLTAADTGTDMVITDSGSVLSGLGISSTNGAGGYRNGLADADSKIEATNDGFKQITFDGTQADNAFLISYDQASKVMTLTKGDGTTDTVTLSSTAIATGKTETVAFSTFGVNIVLDDKFNKSTDITVEADVFNQTGNAGTIDAASIEIIDSAGDISGITSRTLTFDVTTPTAATISVGSFSSAAFDATATGIHDVTLTDGTNSLTIRFDITVALDAAGPPTITLNELKNLVSSTGTPFDNQLQTARSARFTADGLIDADRFESHFITSSTSTLSTLAPEATAGDFKITVGADTVTVNYLLTDTLSGLVTKINDAISAASNGVTTAGTAASLMTDGDGVRLVIAKTSGAAMTLADTNGLVAGLGIDNDLVIERDSNTVSDLFDGVTLTLFQAEEETQIKLDIEKDLASAKTAIEGFVNAYNTLKSFLNLQSTIDSTTGAAAEDSGILFGTSALLGVASSVSSVFSQATAGVDKAFKVLAQVGITFVDNNSVADPMLFNTLEISDTKLDEALLNNPDDVRRLFAFDFSTSDPRVSLLGFTGKTSFNTSGYTLNINFDDRFQSQTFTDGGSFTELDATTAGPAGDGVSAIAFSDSVLSGNAYRYSYDSTGGELLTLTDLTSGTSQTIDITATLDGIGDGGDLDAGETAAFNFSNLGVTLTLTGDGSPTTNFERGTDIITSGSLTVNATNITVNGSTGVVTDNDGGVTQTGLAELKALANPSIYDQATGKLTINFDSSGAGNLVLAAAGTAGLEFSVDSGGFSSAPGTNLDDGLSHTIDIRLVTSQEVIARITVTDVDGTGVAGTLDFDIGTGMFAETSTVAADTAPMENYIGGLSSGQFDIKDSSDTVIGTVSYNKTDSLQDLATAITASVTNVTASVIASGGTFKIEILHDTRDTLTFVSDTGNLVSSLTLTNAGDAVFSANFDGAAGGGGDLSAAVNGRTITGLSLTGAEGLKVFYNGTVDLASIQIDFTTGFGERLFFAIDAMLAPVTGLMDANIASLTKQNQVRHDRVDDMVARLEQTQALLIQKFINMEVALARAKNLRDSLTQTFDAMFASKNF